MESFGSFELEQRGDIDIKVTIDCLRADLTELMILQGKGLMTTYWLTGEKRNDSGRGAADKSDERLTNHDEGIDDIDEITFTFHVSEPANSEEG